MSYLLVCHESAYSDDYSEPACVPVTGEKYSNSSDRGGKEKRTRRGRARELEAAAAVRRAPAAAAAEGKGGGGGEEAGVLLPVADILGERAGRGVRDYSVPGAEASSSSSSNNASRGGSSTAAAFSWEFRCFFDVRVFYEEEGVENLLCATSGRGRILGGMARPNIRRRHNDLQLESVARISRFPIVESGIHIAGNVYEKIKRSNSLMSWSLDTAEQSLALATATALPAVIAFNGPIMTLDQLLCKGIDIFEQRVPAVNLPPHLMYWNTREYVNNKFVKPVLIRADSVKQIGSVVANAAVDKLDGAIDAADQYVDRYLPADPADKAAETCTDSGKCEDSGSGSKAARTIEHGARFSRKLQRRLTRRTLAEARALKEQGTECIHVLLYVVELVATDPKLAMKKARELWASLSLPEPENQARPTNLEQLLVLFTRETARRIVHLVNGTANLASRAPRRLARALLRLSHRLRAISEQALKVTNHTLYRLLARALLVGALLLERPLQQQQQQQQQQQPQRAFRAQHALNPRRKLALLQSGASRCSSAAAAAAAAGAVPTTGTVGNGRLSLIANINIVPLSRLTGCCKSQASEHPPTSSILLLSQRRRCYEASCSISDGTRRLLVRGSLVYDRQESMLYPIDRITPSNEKRLPFLEEMVPIEGKRDAYNAQANALRVAIYRLNSSANRFLEQLASFLAGRPKVKKGSNVSISQASHNNHVVNAVNPPVNGIE